MVEWLFTETEATSPMPDTLTLMTTLPVVPATAFGSFALP